MSARNSATGLWQDIRYAIRTLQRTPAFTSVAVFSLALGIGANTAIFSVIDAVMLRLLPVREPERLVELLHRFPGEPHLNGFSWQSYQYFLEHNRVFSGLIGNVRAPNPAGSSFNVSVEGAEPEKVDGVYVTGSFFPVLGVRPAVGRLLGPEDDRAERPANVAVVSWLVWKNRFGLNPSILGQRIVVDNVPVAIVGVAAREFSGWLVEARQDIWLPLALQPALQPERDYRQSPGGVLTLVGRLRPGISIEQARAEIAVLYRQTLEADPTRGGRFLRAMRFELEPAGAGLSGAQDQLKEPLLVLMAVVALLLLIVCTNVATLLLARGASRHREMAVRVALGAGRFRLARQLLTESLLLSAAGSLPGILLAHFGAATLVRVIAGGREPVSGRPPIELHVTADARVLLFAGGLAVMATLIFGLAPAWRAWRTQPIASLRHAGASSDSRPRLFATSLVAAQIALSLALLASAGVFLDHLQRIYSTLGFDRDRVLLVTLDPSRSGSRREQLSGPYRDLLDRLQVLPGVRSATLSAVTPVQGPAANRDVSVEGYTPGPGELRYAMENWVAPRYFDTLGIPLLMGRDFSFEDQGRPRVAIINQTMARYYFRTGSPLGKHVRFDGDSQPYQIIGVVGDSKYRDVHEMTLRTIYLNAFQEGRMSRQFALRTAMAPAAVAPAVRRAVRTVLKTIPVDHMTTLSDQVEGTMLPERLIVALSALFGAFGSTLAAIGLYGLLAYTAARRTNEIGIRMALGATHAAVIRMVLRDALRMVCIGLLAGSLLAFWSRRFAMSLIPEMTSTLGPSLVFAATAILALSFAAALVPARRAARIDPTEALRHE